MAYGNLNVDVVQSSTAGTPPQFNDGNGTQVGTLCRAWCSYNASTQTIRGSFNISSVTYVGVGGFTFNFTNAMPSANYSSVGMCGGTSGTYEIRGGDGTFQTTTSCTIISINDGSVGSGTNPAYVNFLVFN